MYCSCEVCLAPLESTQQERTLGGYAPLGGMHPSTFDTQEYTQQEHDPWRACMLGDRQRGEQTHGEHAPLEGTLGGHPWRAPFSIWHPRRAYTQQEHDPWRACTLGEHAPFNIWHPGKACTEERTLGEHAINEILTFWWCSYVARKNTPLYAGRKGDF